MDINIIAVDHPNIEALRNHYEQKLNSKFGHYDFVKRADVRVKKNEKKEFQVSIELSLEKGPVIHALASHESENKALFQAIKKLQTQIEKFKAKHYHKIYDTDKLKNGD